MSGIDWSRRQFMQFTAASAVASLFTPAIARAQSRKTLRLALHTAVNSEQSVAAEAFAAKVAEYTGGGLTVTVLPGAQMGGQREIVESVSLGVLEMGFGESGIYSGYVPQFGVVALPYLYKDMAHWDRVVDGEVGTGLAAQLEEASGLKIVNFLTGGYRSTFLRDKAITAPGDFSGVKIRLPEAPVFVRTFSLLGATPTPIPAPEMYSALQTGVVDAMEGSLETGFTYKIYEVCKHLSMTRHILNDGSFIINADLFNGLDDAQKQAVLRAGRETATEQRAAHLARAEMWFGRLKGEGGMRVNEPDLAPFQEKLAPLQDEFAANAGATDILERIRAAG